MSPNLSAVHDFMMAYLMHLLTFPPIYRGMTASVAYPQSLSLAAISFPLCSCELEGSHGGRLQEGSGAVSHLWLLMLCVQTQYL